MDGTPLILKFIEMRADQEAREELLPHLFRLEYSKLTAVLSRHFGLQNIEIAEDIASDTFLKAAEHWGMQGLPDNPTAWLYTVARNKTKDYLKRNILFENRIKPELQGENEYDQELNLSPENINDSQLKMIFAVCNPLNSPQAQISLALQILCGFSVEEIANAFLSNRETIKKRLFRARENLRNQKFERGSLSATEIEERLQNVLLTIYLLFNEGYFSRSGNLQVRRDLCSEALRLGLILVENPLTGTATAKALMSLMCFQSSRIEARQNEHNEAILFEEQDKSLWSRDLIERGIHYLVESSSPNGFSRYHLEASIAYWHTTSEEGRWGNMLQLYNELVKIENSPLVFLSRAFVFAKVHGNEMAIQEIQSSGLDESQYYHSLLGYLYATVDVAVAVKHYEKAITLSNTENEKKSLKKEISKLSPY